MFGTVGQCFAAYVCGMGSWFYEPADSTVRSTRNILTEPVFSPPEMLPMLIEINININSINVNRN